MPLIHEFVTSSENETISFDLTTTNKKIEITDAVIQYLNDTFAWIPTKWNTLDNKQNGLNYYGMTIIELQQIGKFKKVIQAWRHLFSNATPNFSLQGEYNLSENRFERNEFIRAEFLDHLDSLIVLCDEAMKKHHRIVHFGI